MIDNDYYSDGKGDRLSINGVGIQMGFAARAVLDVTLSDPGSFLYISMTKREFDQFVGIAEFEIAFNGESPVRYAVIGGGIHAFYADAGGLMTIGLTLKKI